jgi:PAS domain S-box-containing protein
VELSTYRLVCLLTAGIIPAFGYVYQHIDPTFYDPLWVRWAIGALILGLGVGTYVSAWVRKHLETLALLLVYVLVAWFTILTAVNNLAPEYALGYLFILIMMGLANLGMSQLWATVLLVSLATAAGTAVSLALPNPGVDPGVYALCIAAGGLIICTSTWVRLRMRDHARSSETRYRALFENSTDGLFLLDAHTLAFLHANSAYLSLSGYTLAELRARTLYDVMDADRAFIDRSVRGVHERGHLNLGEQRHHRKDGSTVGLKLGMSLIERAGRTTLYVTAHDLTEQQHIRAELEAAKEEAVEMLRLKSSFLNNMSHELRTPLVSILGFAELLADEADEEQQEIAETIHRSAKRLHDTLNSVLDLAQLESGGVQLDPEVVDVNEEVTSIANQFLPFAESKGLALRVKATPGAHVLANPVGLRRILTHLLTNAIKFTLKGGISIDVEADSHRVLLHVSDTGIGISDDFLPRLFGEFEQASTGMARSHEGSGLGLTITKRLVDLMGGRIMVQSALGEGSTFVVAFPRAWPTPDEVSVDTEDCDTAPVITSRPRALVVEDNADTRRLIAHTLAPYYDVETAANAEGALALAQRAWFDVLLLDVNLGGGPTGLDLLRELRTMSAYAYVPALAVTALSRPHDRERILGHGFDGYLAKPFTRDEMIASIDEVIALQQVAAAQAGAIHSSRG